MGQIRVAYCSVSCCEFLSKRKEWNGVTRLTLDIKVYGMRVRISRFLEIKAIIRWSVRLERDLMSLEWYRSAETLTQKTFFQARLLKFKLLTMPNSCIDASFSRKKQNDTDGIRTHACRAHWISSPTP